MVDIDAQGTRFQLKDVKIRFSGKAGFWVVRNTRSTFDPVFDCFFQSFNNIGTCTFFELSHAMKSDPLFRCLELTFCEKKYKYGRWSTRPDMRDSKAIKSHLLTSHCLRSRTTASMSHFSASFFEVCEDGHRNYTTGFRRLNNSSRI